MKKNVISRLCGRQWRGLLQAGVQEGCLEEVAFDLRPGFERPDNRPWGRWLTQGFAVILGELVWRLQGRCVQAPGDLSSTPKVDRIPGPAGTCADLTLLFGPLSCSHHSIWFPAPRSWECHSVGSTGPCAPCISKANSRAWCTEGPLLMGLYESQVRVCWRM